MNDPMPTLRVLMRDEIEYLNRSARCRQCRHLDVLHDYTDDELMCMVTLCDCVVDRFPRDWESKR
jgi:hypothetical protein